ncbi:hypothetical protein TKK_0019038 [Trichogramma kaykai]|uniref:Lipase n=1 Tax=Trichogramma kaykai TaxID=54128 RepID=A0ABD2VUU6_9HYME
MIFSALIFVAGIAFCSCELFPPSFEEYLKPIKSDPLFVNNVVPPGLNLTDSSTNYRPFRSYLKLTVPKLIEYHGYKAEIHHVTTKDGYILEIHRICGNEKFNSSRKYKPVVYLQHGILTSSIEWVLSGPGKGLGFLLADAGYDVWMGNSRGNTYSRNHKSLSPNYSDFWKFDWHQMGMYDLPASIDYVLSQTKRKKLIYVGFSQGTTSYFVMTSSRPEYNDKIEAMFALAPVAYCSHMYSPILKYLADYEFFLKPLFYLFLGFKGEFQPSNDFFRLFGSLLCHGASIFQPVCLNTFFLIVGYDWTEFDATLMPHILNHIPAGASIHQLTHFAQLISKGDFRQIDSGPKYDLQKISSKIFLYHSKNDWISSVSDVEKLSANLPNLQQRFLVSYDHFNHIDFLWSKHVKELLYDKVMKDMSQFVSG